MNSILYALLSFPNETVSLGILSVSLLGLFLYTTRNILKESVVSESEAKATNSSKDFSQRESDFTGEEEDSRTSVFDPDPIFSSELEGTESIFDPQDSQPQFSQAETGFGHNAEFGNRIERGQKSDLETSSEFGSKISKRFRDLHFQNTTNAFKHYLKTEVFPKEYRSILFCIAKEEEFFELLLAKPNVWIECDPETRIELEETLSGFTLTDSEEPSEKWILLQKEIPIGLLKLQLVDSVVTKQEIELIEKWARNLYDSIFQSVVLEMGQTDASTGFKNRNSLLVDCNSIDTKLYSYFRISLLDSSQNQFTHSESLLAIGNYVKDSFLEKIELYRDSLHSLSGFFPLGSEHILEEIVQQFQTDLLNEEGIAISYELRFLPFSEISHSNH